MPPSFCASSWDLIRGVAGALHDAVDSDSPTNMWCASSVSMNLVMRASNQIRAEGQELIFPVPVRKHSEHEISSSQSAD
jgi:hypothetical protein